VSALERAGWDVRALDVHPPAPWASGQQEYIRADVREGDAVRRALRGCDVLVDNAALVPVSRVSYSEFRSVNVDGCRVALEAARAEGTYVVHVSSSSIYGVPEQLPVTEETPLRPFEPYGRSKAEAELLVARERERGLPIASLRSRALVGRGRLGLFEVVFRRIRDGRRVPLFGRGDITIQMCDAEDFCASALAAIERRAEGDYNIGSAIYGTVREDLEELIRHAGTSARLQPVPVRAIRAVLQSLRLIRRSPLTRWHWVASSTDYYADLSRAEDELGWRPLRSNAEALANAYDIWLEAPSTRGESAHTRPLEGALARLLRG
jgi:nucleoside-diphosphate-sugar epimerase